MNRLMKGFIYIFSAAGMIWIFGTEGYSQKGKPVPPKTIKWLKNKPVVSGERVGISEYSEDAYYGIEKIEKKRPTNYASNHRDEVFQEPRDGTGSGRGSGLGSGTSGEPEPPKKWIPYYDRPSNCATRDYRPEINRELLDEASLAVDRRAGVVRQPRPLYSQTDFLAKRRGTIRLQVLLKADGTVGFVRPLSKLAGDMTQSALLAACYITFYPATVGGKATDSVQTIVYTFKPEQVDDGELMGSLPPADSSVRIISKPRPAYTPEAKSRELQGTVTLRVTFLASGAIGAVVPVKKLSDGLTENAVEAARQMRFEPARRNGKNITIVKLVEYNFTLY